ncbi:MAG TPA: response regulator [Kouleothrix sp.]|uniref:HD domain-containing phosphohydrolase n=1 Tax=Kouleothrix sp. TaxID=2779161 RepID=UPI002B94D510|nr:response regulator [Kouleothrix sp.]HRC76179.1 response regulator [Kouleothrix sp.]
MWIPTTHNSEAGMTYSLAQPRQHDTEPPGYIMVIDDNREAGAALAALLELSSHTVDYVTDGLTALDAIKRHQPDLIILDVQLPGMDGYAICDVLKHGPATWQIPIIMVTVEGQRAARLQGFAAGADAYLQKPVDMQELDVRIRSLLRSKRRTDQLEQAEAVIFALARTVEAKDAYTEGHLQRLALYSVAIGERLGLGADDLNALRFGALLHDVGKVGVDELIIRKGGPLTPAEYRLMQQHTLIGERIVQPLRMAAAVGPIVRHHHERWDGRGYPDGLSRDSIPLGARIVAVADAFDAMTTTRPYNRVLSLAEAAERLRNGAGIFWDPAVVATFLEWLSTAEG